MNKRQSEQKDEILALCRTVRALVKEQKYQECRRHICDAMQKHPHSPAPHNLMGIVLEKEGCHAAAMKHFRAAYDLDPAYLPARCNLEHYGTFFSRSGCAYDENDCEYEAQKEQQIIQYDGHGVGRVVRRD